MNTLAWAAVIGGTVGGLSAITTRFVIPHYDTEETIHREKAIHSKVTDQFMGAVVGSMTGGVTGGIVGATIGGPLGAVIGIAGASSAGAVSGSILGYNAAGVVPSDIFNGIDKNRRD